MKYMKFKADALFTGSEILGSDKVLITDREGVVEDIIDGEDAGEDVRTMTGLLCPGFVNTHCHLELSHMKGRISPGSGLIDFLIKVIKERSYPPEVIQEGIRNGAEELYKSGTVAVGDICNTPDTAAFKLTSPVRWRNFIEVLGFNESTAPDRLAYAERIRRQFASPATLSPHAPYSVSSSLFHLIDDASAGQPVTIHNQEAPDEDELYKCKQGGFFRLYESLSIDPAPFQPSGKSSLQTYLPWLVNASDLLLVHNTNTREEDILFAKKITGLSINLFFCICINANQYITSQVPPLDLFRKHDCALTVGTDSYASNHQLNMLEEIKSICRAFPHVPLAEPLRWATLNGARALRFHEHLGSFEKGKQPGVVLISDVADGKLTEGSVAERIG